MGISGISIGLLGMIIGGIVFTQYQRLIEGKNLAIIAGLTLAVLVIPGLRQGMTMLTVLLVAILAAVGAIALTALLRLIFVQLFRIS
jgi:serine/threonine-protein kinase